MVRWDVPASANGIISHYRLTMWQGDGVIFSNSSVSGAGTEARLSGLRSNVTYQAEVGKGGGRWVMGEC